MKRLFLILLLATVLLSQSWYDVFSVRSDPSPLDPAPLAVNWNNKGRP